MNARLLLTLGMIALAQPTFAAARLTIVNVNAPGVGFNDPTPAVPVGNNPGTTVGEQRLIAFQFAADLWGATLDSNVEVRVQSSFVPLACTPTTGTLGSAGPIQIVASFPGATFADTWYPIALANKAAGEDLIPGDPNTAADDIRARFNSNIGQPNCLAASSWYYGLDTGHAPNQINLVTVLLHEFAHGLGFLSVASVTTGSYPFGLSDVYSKFYFDNTTGKFRDQMTDEERRVSAVNPRNVVWTGDRVTSSVPRVLRPGTPLLAVASPASAQGDYPVGAAAFGPPLSAPGISASIVVATDAADLAGPTTTDACSAMTNAAAVVGRIALVDRGTCGFVVKVKNAQNAGAIAVLVADNVAGGPPAGLGGADPTITIPSVRITLDAGNRIKTALTTGPVMATLTVDPTIRAGADRSDRTLLYTPNPVVPGSSVSHWDTSTTPNQLMEPAINNDLRLSVDVPQDLTLPLMRDIGWYLDRDLDLVPDEGADACLGSNLAPTVIVGNIDTGVPNAFFGNGCSIRDLVQACRANARNHGAYVSCVAHTTNALRDAGIITGAQKGDIQHAVARDK